MKSKFLFADLIVLCTSISIVYAALQVKKIINAYGNVKSLNVQVYQDSACTIVLTQIDWGILSPGQTKTVTCYIKSTSTVNATLLMAIGSWNPSSAASYIQEARQLVEAGFDYVCEFEGVKIFKNANDPKNVWL